MFGVLETISQPKSYFDTHPEDLDEIVGMVQRAFGRHMDFKDIYDHVTVPDELCLVRNGHILAMRSQNRAVLSGIPSLLLEGIAVDPVLQSKGLYGRLLSAIHETETALCLRTQNPHVYAALQRYCTTVYPDGDDMPSAIREIQREFAARCGCEIDEKGIVRGYYGGLFYGTRPEHEHISPLFKQLGLDANNGDALLVVGIR